MRVKYHKQIVDMLYEEWDLGKKRSEAKGKTCAWIYWFEILNEAEKIIVEKNNNKIIGVCAYTKFNSKRHMFRKKYYGIVKKILICSPLIKNKQEIYNYTNNYDYTHDQLRNCFDGEITILIVNKSYRGKGIGRKLISDIFKFASEDNMKNIQILSDESCNYRFYENIGCKMVYETNILSEKGFIYEKVFNK